MKKLLSLALATTLVFGLTACGSSATEEAAPAAEATTEAAAEEVTVVKMGVVGEYNAQWDTVNELLADENIVVELVKFTDYAAPNRALSDGEIDLNAFQHKAFLANEIATAGYDLVSICDTLIAPLSIYPNTDQITTMADIEDGDIIAIPSDATNGGRALKLLEENGLIVCDPEKGTMPSKADITEYIVNIEILEAESATLANLLPDCAAAIINGGNAYTAGLDCVNDAIYTENVDADVNAALPNLLNIIAARAEDADNEVYLKIAAAYNTDEVEATLLEAYKGAFLPAWK